ncbi:MAG: hypothetical protein IJB79_02980 [Candidatus Gastranaerophilales bacterium]|nr:hypothetical protein [Candidatus Gastranaerophilales bacterium]
MRINQIKNTQNFNGLYNNKHLLSTLEKISDHGASFAAGISFLSAISLRPLAISLTPKADSENKKIFSADSIASGVIKLLIALGVSIPIENAIKKINENPKEFLNPDLLKNLSKKDYDFLTQNIKLASNLISAIPKSILSVSLIPLVMDLFHKEKKQNIPIEKKQNFDTFKKQTSFKGRLPEKIVKSVIESNDMQNYAIKNSSNSKNIARNMSVATDILLSATSAVTTLNSKKIKKEQKKPLILNKFISTGISITAGCFIDNLVQGFGTGFVEKFKQANIDDKKLAKYLEGLNIVRPTIIFALIYYGIIPVLTTFASDKLSKVKKEGN